MNAAWMIPGAHGRVRNRTAVLYLIEELIPQFHCRKQGTKALPAGRLYPSQAALEASKSNIIHNSRARQTSPTVL